MKYKIYYDDGFILEGTETTIIPKDRRFGVLVIIEDDPEMNWEVIQGADYYILFGDHWIGVDRIGILDYMVNCISHIKYILVGRIVPYLQHRKILEQAFKDMNPPKTAFIQGEQI